MVGWLVSALTLLVPCVLLRTSRGSRHDATTVLHDAGTVVVHDAERAPAHDSGTVVVRPGAAPGAAAGAGGRPAWLDMIETTSSANRSPYRSGQGIAASAAAPDEGGLQPNWGGTVVVHEEEAQGDWGGTVVVREGASGEHQGGLGALVGSSARGGAGEAEERQGGAQWGATVVVHEQPSRGEVQGGLLKAKKAEAQ